MKGVDWRISLWFGVAAVTTTLVVAPRVAKAELIPGYSDNVQALDPREVALLPGYCKYTQLFRAIVPGGSDQTTVDSWYARLGPEFNHLHHYCLGMMKENRAILLSRDPSSRRFYLNDAIIEYDYVIERMPQDYVLLPEILTKKAQDLVLLGRGPLAEFEFQRAIALKSDYWPPYAYLSDYYKGIGEIGKARGALETGLAKAPETEALQRRLSELKSAKDRRGGKQ